MAICTLQGEISAFSPGARELLRRVGMACPALPCPLPESLWQTLTEAPLGEPIEWHPEESEERWLGITRHRVGDDALLLLMRELTDAHKELGRRLQRQRLESIGRLVAGVAHDLRAPLANIMFGASVLADICAELSPAELREKLVQITDAAARQQATISSLLDFARIGPPAKTDLSLDETFSRVSALLRSAIREGGHQLLMSVSPGSRQVYGNQLVVEQILTNLIMNALEAAQRPVMVQVSSEQSHEANMVELHIIDDGDGIPEATRRHLFEPFFTTKDRGTGLGLATAREAALDQGGDIVLLVSTRGAHFVLMLPNAVTGNTREFLCPEEVK
jgi:signal transduction histidine kinase